MRNKQAITEALIGQYPESQRPGLDWAMQQRNIEHYNFDIRLEQVRPKLLVQLDQRLQDPYYLNLDRKNPNIKFYGSKEAFLANLYGDLDRFLEHYTQ